MTSLALHPERTPHTWERESRTVWHCRRCGGSIRSPERKPDPHAAPTDDGRHLFEMLNRLPRRRGRR